MKYVSLFSGGMGLDIGLASHGFSCVLANEIDDASVQTIRLNVPGVPVIAGDVSGVDRAQIESVSGESAEDIDLLVGGPPCQAFSVIGHRNGVSDHRGQLIFEFSRLVRELKPKAFLMENVRGLHSMPIVPASAPDTGQPNEWKAKGSLLKRLIDEFAEDGYFVQPYLVNAVNYGAPQLRERLILVGNRFNERIDLPEPTHSNRPEDGLPAFRTLGDAINPEMGFVDPDPLLMDFSPRKLSYLAYVPPGGNWRSMPEEIQKESMGKSWYLKGGRSAYWRRLSYSFPSPTVVTMPNHAGTSMCHPDELRALTVGECAAIQEFPSDWKFSGSAAERYRQIGNAVPVRLGDIAGAALKETLTRVARKKIEEQPPSEPEPVKHLRPHVRTRSYWRNGAVHEDESGYYASKFTDTDSQSSLEDSKAVA